jgi:AraC-like DNA-binding protein
MPSSSVRTFTEPDEYAPAGQHSHTRLLAIKRHANFSANFTAIDLIDLRINQFADTLPRIARIGMVGNRILFGFLTQPGASPITDGMEMELDRLYQARANGQEYYRQTLDRTSFVSLSLPPEAMAGIDDLASRMPAHDGHTTYAPPPAALAKLRRLNEAAGTLAEQAPGVLASRQAARGLEQAFIGAIVDCVDGEVSWEDRSALRQHAAIMRRFHGKIEESADRPLYIPEICKAIGVSERTLRTCCDEDLGMGPKHYLMLRRMNLARRALLRADATRTSVTAVATDYGFWELGRFSVEYRVLFGEAPSATLQRAPEDRTRHRAISDSA